mgnify:FL=1
MLETTGCDAVMIARGAIGDPLIFKRTLHYLKTGKSEPFNFKDNIEYFKDYLKLAKKHKLADNNLVNIKHLGTKFLRNIEGASKLRNELMQLKTVEEIEGFFEKISKQ